MFHDQLIYLARQFGYTSITYQGLCKGFSGMYIQAVCSGDLASFYRRLRILDEFAFIPAFLPGNLKQAVDEVRELVKKGEKLSEYQQDLLEIPAFFDGIALYLRPTEYEEVFGGKLILSNYETAISSYLQSKKLENLGGLQRAFNTNDQYTPAQLTDHLNNISRKLRGRPNVAIDFVGGNHSVVVRVLNDGNFEIIDTNNLDLIGTRLTTKELASQLNTSLFNDSWLDWFTGPSPLLMSTSIFTNNQTQLDLEDLRATGEISDLITDSNNYNLLELAASNNDFATLERINLDNNDQKSELLGTALTRAAPCNTNEAAKHLLSIPGMNVCAPNNQCPALFLAIISKNYTLARKITEHSTFNPNLSLPDGNFLHCIANTNGANQEGIDFARYLINEKHVDINKKNDKGETPLHEACRAGNIELVNLFVATGANRNLRSKEGFTPLDLARKNKHPELISSLDLKKKCNEFKKEYTNITQQQLTEESSKLSLGSDSFVC